MKAYKIRLWIARKLFDLASLVSPSNDVWERLYKHTKIFGTGMVIVDPKNIYKDNHES